MKFFSFYKFCPFVSLNLQKNLNWIFRKTSVFIKIDSVLDFFYPWRDSNFFFRCEKKFSSIFSKLIFCQQNFFQHFFQKILFSFSQFLSLFLKKSHFILKKPKSPFISIFSLKNSGLPFFYIESTFSFIFLFIQKNSYCSKYHNTVSPSQNLLNLLINKIWSLPHLYNKYFLSKQPQQNGSTNSIILPSWNPSKNSSIYLSKFQRLQSSDLSTSSYPLKLFDIHQILHK